MANFVKGVHKMALLNAPTAIRRLLPGRIGRQVAGALLLPAFRDRLFAVIVHQVRIHGREQPVIAAAAMS